MAFQAKRSGDRFRIHDGSVVPKGYSASYTAPAPTVGHLVKVDTATNDGVLRCAGGDPPYGMGYSINSGNGTISTLRFARIHSIVLEYQTAPALGDKIAAHGSSGTIPIDGVLRDRIITDNVDGVGTVTALDSPLTGLCIVEFPAEQIGT